MTHEEFEQLVAQEFDKAIPEKFLTHIKNVAFLVEDEPSQELRKLEKLDPHETLLGHYHGIPMPMRGDWYGMGTTMPDTITLFQKPIEEEARSEQAAKKGRTRASAPERTLLQPEHEAYVRKVIRETIWHEVAHHFGFDEDHVQERERRRDGMLPQ